MCINAGTDELRCQNQHLHKASGLLAVGYKMCSHKRSTSSLWDSVKRGYGRADADGGWRMADGAFFFFFKKKKNGKDIGC